MKGWSKDLVEIALGFDSNFAPHIAALICSIIDNTRGAELRFIILSTDTDECFRARIQRAFASAKFEWIEVRERDVPAFKARAGFTRAVLFRLAIDKLAPQDCKRVIYFDTDVVVTADVRELWETELGEYTIGAVPEESCNAWHALAFAERWGLPPGTNYFNSGVLLIDLEKARSTQTFSLATDFVARCGELSWPDQDALNFVFWQNWLKLDPAWNVQRPSALAFAFGDRHALRGGVPKIIHFTGTEKPWLINAYHPWAWLYWRALKRTPFASDVERLAHFGAFRRTCLWLRWQRRGFRNVHLEQVQRKIAKIFKLLS